MIGDTNADIQLGRNFGATTIWCAWGYVTAPSEHPDREARTAGDLADIVRQASEAAQHGRISL